MEHKLIDGHLFAQMIYAGSDHLKMNSKRVDDLNVFPVPDGDTGTNMTLSITSGANELRKNASDHIGHAAQALSKGLLMGARGNSGVILSQLFRGFGKAVSEHATIDAHAFTDALQHGVDAAYKAVMKPVEGTILTVAKEAAKAAVEKVKKEKDITLVMAEVLKSAKEALAKTPDQLPILKEVGVVDAGGQGLIYVYEGFLAVLRGEEVVQQVDESKVNLEEITEMAHDHLPAQANMRPEDIEFGYCTEFIIGLNDTYTGSFAEDSFRDSISRFGDSLLVISDDELVKVHIHAEYPGDVLSFAQEYGHFKKIKIENMREQLELINEEVQDKTIFPTPSAMNNNADFKQPYAILAVAAGPGIEDIFKSLDVDIIIRGGQTMNPSTEDIVRAAEQVNAEKILILPNNSNIIMAAEQAKELLNTPTEVVPTKSIPQGIAALIAFDSSIDLNQNKQQMTNALQYVKTGQVTHAVRDSKFGDLDIKEGHFLGIHEKDIVVSESDIKVVCEKLISTMVEDDTSVITIIYGEDSTEEMADELKEFITSQYPDVEIEVHYGGQPVYMFLFSVE